MENTVMMSYQNKIWHHIGYPKTSGVYQRENPESNEDYFCYYDSELQVWLQGYSNKKEAEEKAVDWMILSKENKYKQMNKMSSSWQKLSWC